MHGGSPRPVLLSARGVTTDLTGARAIVTGSTTGIGYAIARALLDRGARVMCNSRQSAWEGPDLTAQYEHADYVRGDVSQRGQAAALVQSVTERWGGVDILINNAGTTRKISHADVDAVTDEVWEAMLHGNVLGAWHMIQECVPAMRHQGAGSIINITSLAGIEPSGSSVPYAAMKAALNHTTKLLAKSLGPEITVNAVAPGFIDTRWTAPWSDERARAVHRAPLGRTGTPQDVADSCLALLGQPYVTGVIIPVDGGTHLS